MGELESTQAVPSVLTVQAVPVKVTHTMILENKKGIEKSKRDLREIRVFKRKCMRLS